MLSAFAVDCKGHLHPHVWHLYTKQIRTNAFLIVLSTVLDALSISTGYFTFFWSYVFIAAVSDRLSLVLAWKYWGDYRRIRKCDIDSVLESSISSRASIPPALRCLLLCFSIRFDCSLDHEWRKNSRFLPWLDGQQLLRFQYSHDGLFVSFIILHCKQIRSLTPWWSF